MDRLSRTRLALKVLECYDSGPRRFRDLPEAQLHDAAPEIIGTARDLLITQIAKMLDELSALGFSNKEVSETIEFDESEVSRAHGAVRVNQHRRKTNSRGGDGLSMGLDKMQVLMEKLRAFLPVARFTRLQAATSPAQLRSVDYCWSGQVSKEQEHEIVSAVHHNLIAGLSGKTTRKSLPKPFGGAILALGLSSNLSWVIQWEGTSDIEQRANRLHELMHFVEREEAELEKLRSQENHNANQKPTQRPSRY